MTYLDRLRVCKQATPGTDKTDKTPHAEVLSVLSPPPEACSDTHEALAAPPEPDRLLDLYRELFEGHAPRAMVSLDSRQVRRAVDMGALDPVLAAASVVVAYRNGEAQALVAVPREKHDGLAILQAFHETTVPADNARAGSGSPPRA